MLYICTKLISIVIILRYPFHTGAVLTQPKCTERHTASTDEEVSMVGYTINRPEKDSRYDRFSNKHMLSHISWFPDSRYYPIS